VKWTVVNSALLVWCVRHCIAIVVNSGDLPLHDDVRRRLRRTKAKLVEILYTNMELLDHLLSMNVISETDHQSVLAECTTDLRNARLIDILLRGSERSLKCFAEALQLVHQGYVVDYLEKGTAFDLIYVFLICAKYNAVGQHSFDWI